MDLRCDVIVDPSLPDKVSGSISFDTGADPGLHVYGVTHVGPLMSFYEDLIVGLPMPLTFATHRVNGPHTVVAAALFLDRQLALLASTPGFVYLVDLVCRFGDPMLAHADPQVARFIRGLYSNFPLHLTQQQQGNRLKTAVQWVRDYLLTGELPNLGAHSPEVTIQDRGSNGFVVAETKGNTVLAWETLFRLGFLKGFVVGDRQVTAARKNVAVGFDLERLSVTLNQMQGHNGMAWTLKGDYLGTIRTPLSYNDLVQVFRTG